MYYRASPCDRVIIIRGDFDRRCVINVSTLYQFREGTSLLLNKHAFVYP